MIKSILCIEHTVNNLLPFNIIIYICIYHVYSFTSLEYCCIGNPTLLYRKNKIQIHDINKRSWWHMAFTKTKTSIEITNKLSVTRTETLLWNRYWYHSGPVTTEKIVTLCVCSTLIYIAIWVVFRPQGSKITSVFVILYGFLFIVKLANKARTNCISGNKALGIQFRHRQDQRTVPFYNLITVVVGIL